jgi:hypothetical protein
MIVGTTVIDSIRQWPNHVSSPRRFALTKSDPVPYERRATTLILHPVHALEGADGRRPRQKLMPD